jgi:hypothetical protein
MNRKLGRLKKSELTGFLMSLIICKKKKKKKKSNNSSKSEVMWSQRKVCILMNYCSICP